MLRSRKMRKVYAWTRYCKAISDFEESMGARCPWHRMGLRFCDTPDSMNILDLELHKRGMCTCRYGPWLLAGSARLTN